MSVRLALGAITDEFSPDLSTALSAMAESAMTAVELRTIGGRNIVDLSNDEIDEVRDAVDAAGMRVVSIASPVLKCTLPDGPPIDPRFQQDVFGSTRTFDDQPALIERTFDVAARAGAQIIRVFSYWRTIDPPKCFGAVTAALEDLARRAAPRGFIIGLENEHACNVGTADETARVLDVLDHPALQAIWDPANALVAGDAVPFPDGYRRLPPRRIVHVHAKDCVVNGHTPTWGPIGETTIDWGAHIRALVDDGFRGAISLETHWRGPNGDRLEASRISARTLRRMIDEAVGDS